MSYESTLIFLFETTLVSEVAHPLTYKFIVLFDVEIATPSILTFGLLPKLRFNSLTNCGIGSTIIKFGLNLSIIFL